MIARALLIVLALTAACKKGSSLCASDTQCTSGFFCDPATGACRCAADSSCGAAEMCNLAGFCQPRLRCDSTADCADGTLCGPGTIVEIDAPAPLMHSAQPGHEPAMNLELASEDAVPHTPNEIYNRTHGHTPDEDYAEVSNG